MGSLKACCSHQGSEPSRRFNPDLAGEFSVSYPSGPFGLSFITLPNSITASLFHQALSSDTHSDTDVCFQVESSSRHLPSVSRLCCHWFLPFPSSQQRQPSEELCSSSSSSSSSIRDSRPPTERSGCLLALPQISLHHSIFMSAGTRRNLRDRLTCMCVCVCVQHLELQLHKQAGQHRGCRGSQAILLRH